MPVVGVVDVVDTFPTPHEKCQGQVTLLKGRPKQPRNIHHPHYGRHIHYHNRSAVSGTVSRPTPAPESERLYAEFSSSWCDCCSAAGLAAAVAVRWSPSSSPQRRHTEGHRHFSSLVGNWTRGGPPAVGTGALAVGSFQRPSAHAGLWHRPCSLERESF